MREPVSGRRPDPLSSKVAAQRSAATFAIHGFGADRPSKAGTPNRVESAPTFAICRFVALMLISGDEGETTLGAQASPPALSGTSYPDKVFHERNGLLNNLARHLMPGNLLGGLKDRKNVQGSGRLNCRRSRTAPAGAGDCAVLRVPLRTAAWRPMVFWSFFENFRNISDDQPSLGWFRSPDACSPKNH